jgi:hypothetical protein
MNRPTRIRSLISGLSRLRPPAHRRRLVGLRPLLEGLEDRTVLSTIV